MCCQSTIPSLGITLFIFQLVPCKSCHFNNLLTEAGVMHGAGYVDYLEHLVPLLKLDINIFSILHYLGSPLGFCTLIFDIMRNLYIYNACIYIHSIVDIYPAELEIKDTTDADHRASYLDFSIITHVHFYKIM